MSITVVLTNWRRVANLSPILEALRAQTLRPRIFLWNNGPPLDDLLRNDRPVDWVCNSNVNKFCWPRWFMAAQAETEFVAVHDDDLCLADEWVLEAGAGLLASLGEAAAVGPYGVVLGPDGEYAGGEHWKANASQSRRVDVVKGRFCMVRTSALREVSMQPADVHLAYSDDITISAALAQGRRGRHLVPREFAGRFRDLPSPHALEGRSGHYRTRDRDANLLFAAGESTP